MSETKTSSVRNTGGRTPSRRVIVTTDATAIGAIAAGIIGAIVEADPRTVLGVATGSSPLATYAELAKRARSGALDLSHSTAFALDEYAGLAISDPRSYAATIHSTVTAPLGLDPANVYVPDGVARDQGAAAAKYERMIADAGGIDLQILGIGSNGHLGFNEPGSSFDSRTRRTRLTEQTRADNARYFTSIASVPTYCITQGLGTILEARRLILLAHGPEKAHAVMRALEGPVSTDCPASVLQLHPDVTVVLDDSAAALLS